MVYDKLEDIVIKDVQDFNTHYNRLILYVKNMVVRKYQVSHYIDYNDVLNNLILTLADRILKGDSVELNANYLKMAIHNQILKFIKKDKVKRKYIHEYSEYVDNNGELVSIFDSIPSEEPVDVDKYHEEDIYLNALDIALDSLSKGDRLLLEYDAKIYTTLISEITGLDTHTISYRVKTIKKNLKKKVLEIVSKQI